jgi:hypothetical protein
MDLIINKTNECNAFISDNCKQLNNKRNLIFELNNNISIVYINKLRGYHGSYERYDERIENIALFLKKNGSYNNNIILLENELSKINGNGIDHPTLLIEHRFDNNNDYIIRKNKIITIEKPKGEIIKTKYYITYCEPFGTGDLSHSLLIDIKFLSIKTNDPLVIDINEKLIKATPIDMGELFNNTLNDISNIKRDYYTIIGNRHDEQNIIFKNALYFMFIKEALFGCWIRDNLILKKITPTIMCVSDAYLLKGLPISKNNMSQFRNKILNDFDRKYKKKWLKYTFSQTEDDLNSSDKLLSKTLFGMIEMEKADETLYNVFNKKIIDEGTLFELFYTKLILTVIGNARFGDDHYNNIMVKYTNKIRKYIIKNRGYEYKFFITNNHIIKFIDLEYLVEVKKRNKYVEKGETTEKIFSSFDISYSYSSSIVEGIYKYIKKTLFSKEENQVDNFCELMTRCLPEKYTDESLYIGNSNIEEYYLNLDLSDDIISSDFLHKINDQTISRNKPYVPTWLRSPPPSTIIDPLIGGNILKQTPKLIKYKINKKLLVI